MRADRHVQVFTWRQAGRTTPDLFNLVLEYLLADVVESWGKRNMGPKMLTDEAGNNSNVNQVIWCDNVWIVADSRKDLGETITDATAAIHAGGFRWKASSLQIMVGGDAIGECLSGVGCKGVDGSRLAVQAVTCMTILGEQIDNQASTTASINYRLTRAEGHIWHHSKVCFAKAPVDAKLSAWSRGPRASALFCCITWHLTRDILQHPWSWEQCWWRRIFKLRRRPAEDYATYLQRTSARIKTWFANMGTRPIHIQLLHLYYDAAFLEGGASTEDGRQLLLHARSFRPPLGMGVHQVGQSKATENRWLLSTDAGTCELPGGSNDQPLGSASAKWTAELDPAAVEKESERLHSTYLQSMAFGTGCGWRRGFSRTCVQKNHEIAWRGQSEDDL